MGSPDGIRKAETLLAEWQSVREDIAKLTEKAESGDSDALMKLVMTASFSTCALAEIQVRKPEIIRPLLSTSAYWPTIASNNDLLNQQMINELRSNGFGSEESMGAIPTRFRRAPTLSSTIAFLLCTLLEDCWSLAKLNKRVDAALKLAKTSRQYSRPERALREVLLFRRHITKHNFELAFVSSLKPLCDEILDETVEECSGLDPLAEDSWKAWFAVARKLFMNLTDGRPEEIPELQKIGGLIINPANKKITFEGDAYKPSMHRGMVRDKIVSSIRYAFKAKVLEGQTAIPSVATRSSNAKS